MYTYERSESSNISLEVFQNINPYISGVYGRIWTILGLLEPGEVGEGGGRVPEGRGGIFDPPTLYLGHLWTDFDNFFTFRLRGVYGWVGGGQKIPPPKFFSNFFFGINGIPGGYKKNVPQMFLDCQKNGHLRAKLFFID